jgi:hypothetical protein
MEPQTHHRISGIYVTFLHLKTLVHLIGQLSGRKSGNQMPDSTRTISTAIPCKVLQPLGHILSAWVNGAKGFIVTGPIHQRLSPIEVHGAGSRAHRADQLKGRRRAGS